MAYWLLKTEPSEYSFADLQREKKATWDGVTNALALKHIRTIQKGDGVLIYHTGDEKQIVGIAEVTSTPYADPNGDSEKQLVVDLKPKRSLKTPITLSQIKTDKAFEGWDLLRIRRLSVVPTSASIWNRIETLQHSAT